VAAWQSWLSGRHYAGAIDGVFGARTDAATRDFQTSVGLDADGIRGPATLRVAVSFGFVEEAPTTIADYPKPPPWRVLAATDRDRLYGPAPLVAGPRGSVVPVPGWVAAHTVEVPIPGRIGRARVHALVADSFTSLWSRWQRAGLSDRIVTFDGAHAARMKRSKVAQAFTLAGISSHAYGIAFDVNARANAQGAPAAAWGAYGSVRELVTIALGEGWAWGGHFSRPDAMHFERAL